MDDERDRPEYEPRFDPFTPPPGQRPGDSQVDLQPEPDSSEVQGRIERIDHKVGVRSYAGGLAVVIALAGAIIAVVLALGARDDSATKNQVQSLQTEIAQDAAQANKETEQKVADLSDKVDEISGSIDDLQGADSTNASGIDSVQGELDDLKGQISDLQASQESQQTPNDSSGGVSPGDGKGLGDDIQDAIGGN